MLWLTLASFILANPQEISGTFSDVDVSSGCQANSIQGQYGGISEQEEPKCDRQEPVFERSDVSNEYREDLSMSASGDTSVKMIRRSGTESNVNPKPPIARLYSQQPKIIVNSGAGIINPIYFSVLSQRFFL